MAKKILVVDDKVDDLELMKTILEKEGYKVVTANNGAEALDTIKKHTFDLLLIDLLMPTLSGYDLLLLVREKVDRKMPMMYVSIIPKKEADLTDIDGFIQKPFSPEGFIAQVKQAMKNFRGEKK